MPHNTMDIIALNRDYTKQSPQNESDSESSIETSKLIFTQDSANKDISHVINLNKLMDTSSIVKPDEKTYIGSLGDFMSTNLSSSEKVLLTNLKSE